jgi:cell pole-organizing protein PopZ
MRVRADITGGCADLGRNMVMSRPVKAQEPSIEEILVSIRNSIVLDDDAGKPDATKAQRAPMPATARADVKNNRDGVDAVRGRVEAAGDKEPDLAAEAPQVTAEVIALGEGLQANASANNSIDHAVDGDIDGAPGPGHTRAPQEPRAKPVADRPLLSPRTTAVIDSAFNSLSHTVLTQNPRTIEDLVRDMLRPMLKTWLDENLPDLVERLVRAEIERVSRGRG